MMPAAMPGAPAPADAAVAPGRLPELRLVATIAGKEIRDSLRNRWFLLYSATFGLLSLSLAGLALSGTGMYGFAGFGRTAASLVNLVILIVPLMALTTAAASISGERERGTLNYLLAQPVSALEVLGGKFLGLTLALLASLSLGFGATALVIFALGRGGGDGGAYAALVGFSFLLALAMSSLGLLISVLAPRAQVAGAVALFLWLALVFGGDLGLMGGTLAFRLGVQDLFRLSLLNPLQVFKMAALGSLHSSLDLLGPAGLYATQTFGRGVQVIFVVVLAAWAMLPLGIACGLFSWRSRA